MEKVGDKFVDSLCELHVAFKVFLIRREYAVVNEMMKSFTALNDINELKTILVITKSFKENEIMKSERERLLGIYNSKYAKL